MGFLATRFDSEDERDSSGRLFSETWAHDGHGSYCGGVITRVLVKKGRQPQIYKIKWDDGSTMNCQEEHVEHALEEDSEEDSEDARDDEYNSDRDSGNQSTENEDERHEQKQEEAKTDSENDMAVMMGTEETEYPAVPPGVRSKAGLTK